MPNQELLASIDAYNEKLNSKNNLDPKKRLLAVGEQSIPMQADPKLEQDATEVENQAIDTLQAEKAAKEQAAAQAEAMKPKITEVAPGTIVNLNPNTMPKTTDEYVSGFQKELAGLNDRSASNINRLFDSYRERLDAEEAPTKQVIKDLERGKFVNDLTPLLFFTKNGDQAMDFITRASQNGAAKEKALLDLRMQLANRNKILESERMKALLDLENKGTDDARGLVLADKKGQVAEEIAAKRLVADAEKANKLGDTTDKNWTYVLNKASNDFDKSTEKDVSQIRTLNDLQRDVLSNTGPGKNPWKSSAIKTRFVKGVLGETGVLTDQDIKRASGYDSLPSNAKKLLDGKINSESDLTDEDLDALARYVSEVRAYKTKELGNKTESAYNRFVQVNPDVDPKRARGVFTVTRDFDSNKAADERDEIKDKPAQRPGYEKTLKTAIGIGKKVESINSKEDRLNNLKKEREALEKPNANGR